MTAFDMVKFLIAAGEALLKAGEDRDTVCRSMITAGVVLAEQHGDKAGALKLVRDLQRDIEGEMH